VTPYHNVYTTVKPFKRVNATPVWGARWHRPEKKDGVGADDGKGGMKGGTGIWGRGNGKRKKSLNEMKK